MVNFCLMLCAALCGALSFGFFSRVLTKPDNKPIYQSLGLQALGVAALFIIAIRTGP